MKIKNSIILFLSFLVPHFLHAMEPTQPVQEMQKCSICLDEIKDNEGIRRFSCQQHPLHHICYKQLCDTAIQSSKKEVICPTCRAPIKFFHLGFTQEDRHQVTQLLKNRGATPAIIEDPEIRKHFLKFIEEIQNDHKDGPSGFINLALSHLELRAMRPHIPHIIQQYAVCDAQVDTFLEKEADNQAQLKILTIQNPPEAFAFLTREFDRKNAVVEKFRNENKDLNDMLAKKTKKNHDRKKELEDEWTKRNFALSTLEILHAKLNRQKALNACIKISILSYVAHRGARYLKPDSNIYDLVVTVSTIGLSTLWEFNSYARNKSHQRATIERIQGY